MDFAFTPEQDAIRDTAERFARDRLAPGYQARAQDGRLDRDLVREMGSLGLIAPDLPEAYGGLGVDGVTGGVVVEAVAHGDFQISYVQLLGALVGRIVCDYSNADLAGHWVPKVVAGEALIGLGQIGYVKAIRLKLDEIDSEHPEHADFVAEMRSLVDRFDLDQYMTTLKTLHAYEH